jgi:hypothetical protein
MFTVDGTFADRRGVAALYVNVPIWGDTYTTEPYRTAAVAPDAYSAEWDVQLGGWLVRAPIPEPATLTVLGVGLLGLVALGKKRLSRK